MSTALFSRGACTRRIAKLIAHRSHNNANSLKRIAKNNGAVHDNIICWTNNNDNTLRDYSSAVPIDAIKESIKSSLLEEASKKDSSFWDEKLRANASPDSSFRHSYSITISTSKVLILNSS